MSAIFISHSSQDKAIADEVKYRLVKQGHRSLFLDFDPEFGIPPGRNWAQELYQQLRSCQGFIVLCTKHSMTSQWVFAEVTHAKGLGKHIFPIKVDDYCINTILTGDQVLDLTKDPEVAYRQLWRGLKEAGLDPANLFDWDGSRSPYPGLIAFEEADAAVFFGRDAEIQQVLDLLNRLRQFGGARLLMVLGASGSGKSSLVRAGLMPRLRRNPDMWLLVEPFRPQKDALKELAIVLAAAFEENQEEQNWRDIRETLQKAADADPVRGDALIDLVKDLRIAAKRREATVLLLIDQTEEILPDGDSAEASRFFRLLRAALEVPNSALMAICTLRSDFLGVFQQHPATRDLRFEDVKVGPPSKASLVQVIEGPVDKAGIQLEKGLTQTMVDDTETEDALPLLAFTLRELYEHHGDDKLLTVVEYRDELGGLAGSVKKAADAVFAARPLSTEEVTDLRNAFLGMVRVNDAGQYARQVARWADVPVRVHELLERFIQSRLLISREEDKERVLEVAHEALFRSWDRLRKWLDEDRDRLRLRERLRQAAQEWDQNDRDPNLLVHHGSRLQEVEELLQMPRFALNERENAYVEACVAQREAAHEANRRRADAARVAIATDWLARDPTKAAMVLLEVEDPDNTPFAILRMNEVLRQALLVLERRPHDSLSSVSFSPDGEYIVTASPDRTARVWRADGSGEPVILHHGGQLYTASFSADGKRVLTTGNDGTAKVWRADGSGTPVVLEYSGDLATFSPQGDRVAIASQDGSARVWRADGADEPVDFRPVNPFSSEPDDFGFPTRPEWLYRKEKAVGAPGWVHIGPPRWYYMRMKAPFFSPDGDRIVTGSLDGTAQVWRTDGSGIPVIFRHHDSVISATFSPDGQRVVTASYDGTARVWRADGSGEPVVLQHNGPVILALFSSDGERIVTASVAGTAHVWPADGSGEPIVLRHDGPVTSALFSPDGERVVTASEDGLARAWSADGSGDPVVLQHNGPVISALFSPDGERLVTASEDGLVRVWSIKPVMFRHRASVSSAVFSPNGKHIMTVSKDRTVRVWQVDKHGRPIVLRHNDEVLSASFSADGERVVTASQDGTAQVCRVDRFDEPVVLQHDKSANLAAFSLDGERVLTGSADGLTRVWRTDGRGEPIVLGPPGGYKGTLEVNAASFSPDGEWVLTASGPMVRIWRADGKGEPVQFAARHYGGYIERITQAQFSPDGKQVITVVEGTKVRVWPADGAGEPIELQHNGGISAVAISPDGRRIVTVSSYDGLARVWSADGSGALAVLPHKGSVISARFSPDGERIVIISGDNSMRVWQANGTGEPVVLWHEGEISSAMFSADGKRIVTVSKDGSARVWRTDGLGEPLMLWHEGSVNASSFSPDGNRIVTASEDGTARVWSLSGDLLQDAIRKTTTICLDPEFYERYLGETPEEARRKYEACERAHGREPKLEV